MIFLENVAVYGFEPAIRGMRNPMNSWAKSDSDFTVGDWHIGKNDMELMMKLAKAGSEHAKYRRMIVVWVDITAPLYWWAEADTYKVGTVRNSCSKMHKLLSKPFEVEDFSFEQLPGYKRDVKQYKPYVDEELEIWRRYDADYDVSNQGRIRHGSRILSGSLHQDGYIFCTLHGKQIPLHRLIAEKFIPNPQGKREVNHIDGNKQNNQIANLEWVTRSENTLHAIQNGLQPKMSGSGYTGKFSQEQREEIKRAWDNGESARFLAEKYGVSHTCINDIVHDKYKYAGYTNVFELAARPYVDMLNELRDSYLMCEEPETKKEIWYTIIQLLPESYNQKATLMLSYETLANIYRQRKNHKLDEWRMFCDWIDKRLPCSQIITLEEGRDTVWREGKTLT